MIKKRRRKKQAHKAANLCVQTGEVKKEKDHLSIRKATRFSFLPLLSQHLRAQ